MILRGFFLFSLILFSQLLSGQSPEGMVIDKVVAVVGKEYILLSDIEQQFLHLRMQGEVRVSEQYTRCRILEGLLFEKLLLHQAEIDSVEVTPEQVDAELERRMRYFISQFGSQDKLEKFYDKTVEEFKRDLRDAITKQIKIEKVEQTITEHVSVSPAEVRKFFRSIPRDSIPLIPSMVEIAHLVRQPVISAEEKMAVRERLQNFRKRILDGETSFEALAALYSEDPGSARQGGDIGLRGRGELYPEFEAVAFKLEPGQISEVIETEAGFHIIQGIERRGEFVRVRHILLKPKVSPLELEKERTLLDSIARQIRNGSLTFDQAVVQFSTDPSRNNAGNLINPMTGSTLWAVDELDPKVFFIIDKLEPGMISAPVPWQDEKGNEGYRILYLRKRTPPHRANLEEDYDQIQSWALARKKAETIKDWIARNSRNAYIHIDDNFKVCDFEYKWF